MSQSHTLFTQDHQLTLPLTVRDHSRKAVVKTDAFQSYDTFIGEYKSVSLALDVKADLPSHVVRKVLNALFHYIGKVEASICKSPSAWSMGMLKTAFLGLQNGAQI